MAANKFADNLENPQNMPGDANATGDNTTENNSQIEEMKNWNFEQIEDYVIEHQGAGDATEEVKQQWIKVCDEFAKGGGNNNYRASNIKSYLIYGYSNQQTANEGMEGYAEEERDTGKIFEGVKIIASSDAGTGGTITDPIVNPEYYKPTDTTATGKVEQMGKVIVGAINVIGIVVSVVSLIIIGIRYMLGSVDEKAEYKQTMGPYIIGAILVFATTTIVNMIYQFAITL